MQRQAVPSTLSGACICGICSLLGPLTRFKIEIVLNMQVQMLLMTLLNLAVSLEDPFDEYALDTISLLEVMDQINFLMSDGGDDKVYQTTVNDVFESAQYAPHRVASLPHHHKPSPDRPSQPPRQAKHVTYAVRHDNHIKPDSDYPLLHLPAGSDGSAEPDAGRTPRSHNSGISADGVASPSAPQPPSPVRVTPHASLQHTSGEHQVPAGRRPGVDNKQQKMELAAAQKAAKKAAKQSKKEEKRKKRGTKDPDYVTPPMPPLFDSPMYGDDVSMH